MPIIKLISAQAKGPAVPRRHSIEGSEGEYRMLTAPQNGGKGQHYWLVKGADRIAYASEYPGVIKKWMRTLGL